MKAYTRLLFVFCALHAGAARTATFNVGPDGSFTTIQAAINAAIAAGGSNQIRVEAGIYDENLTLTQTAGTLDIQGGWNAAFTQRNPDPTATEISGGVSARVLNAAVNGGQFTFSGFFIVGGAATDRGGGVYLHAANNALAQIHDSRFVFNTVTATGSANALGGAFYAELFNSAALVFEGNVIDSNSATVSSGVANGGGMFIEAFDSSDVALSDCILQNNVSKATDASGHASAGGAQFDIAGNALITVSRTRFLANSLQASDATHASFSGAFVSGSCTGNCEFDFTQDTFDGNHGLAASQLAVGMQAQGMAGNPKVYAADVQISRGDGGGLYLQMDQGTANLVSFSVADNAGTGIYLVPNATISLYNSLAFGNNANLIVAGPGSAQLGNNLTAGDPLFIDAAHGNYRLQAGSPARDAGTASPPGGLGLFDLDGNPRTFGPAPDIGAFEIGDGIFKDGFD